MHIERIPFDPALVEKDYARQLKSIEQSKVIFNEGRYSVFKEMYAETLAAANLSVVLEKPKEEIKANFYLFLDVAISLFRMGTNIGTEISFSFEGKEYQYTPEDVNYMLNDQLWITAFFAALLFMDIKKISELNKTDLEKVMEVTNVTGGEYSYLFAKFLQHVFKNDQDNYANLDKASDKITPELMSREEYDFALEITGAQVDLFGAAMIKDKAHFNKIYLTSVQWYKDYYAKKDPDSDRALFALGLTAICMLAKHYKIEIEHTSEYTPAIFMNGF